MKTGGVIALTVVMAALGAGGGFAGGFVYTVVDKVHTDTQVGCALLQTAETAGYITREQRGQLLDMVVPPRDTTRPGADRIREFADAWWDSIREDQKSGCPDV
jgi:hypothetical protein